MPSLRTAALPSTSKHCDLRLPQLVLTGRLSALSRYCSPWERSVTMGARAAARAEEVRAIRQMGNFCLAPRPDILHRFSRSFRPY